VQSDDAGRAAEILARSTEDLEPAEETASEKATATDPASDPNQTQPLVVAAAFDSVRALLDAQVVLASANIRFVAPVLAPRGDRPPGTGKRFILRVVKDDLPRAQSLIWEQDDMEDPRCPKCGSWRVFPDATWLETLSEITGLGHKPPKKYECLACKFHGTEAEFFNRS
jgi:hypothetical protein